MKNKSTLTETIRRVLNEENHILFYKRRLDEFGELLIEEIENLTPELYELDNLKEYAHTLLTKVIWKFEKGWFDKPKIYLYLSKVFEKDIKKGYKKYLGIKKNM
jgi:hypothetical protein